MPYRFLARTAGLLRGFVGVRLQYAEGQHAEAVYQNAIERQRKQYDRLKEAVARLAYQKGRLAHELQQQQHDLQVVEQALTKAARENDDARALALLEQQRELHSVITQRETTLQNLTRQTEQATETLQELARALQQLRDEQAEMLCRKASATARHEMAMTLQRVTERPATGDPALANAREAILRLEQMAELELPLRHDAGSRVSLTTLRREAQVQEDQQALAALKQRLRGEIQEG